MLTLLGFRSINLTGVTINDHYITNEPIHSVDIISSDSNLLLSVDCTTAIPDEKSVKQMYDAARYISGKIDQSVVPIIVSSQNCSARKESAKEKGVSVIDSQDVDIFFKLLKKDYKRSTKDLFYKVISTDRQIDCEDT